MRFLFRFTSVCDFKKISVLPRTYELFFNVSFVYVSGVRGSSCPEKRSNFLYLRRLVAQNFLYGNNSYPVELS